MEIEKIPLQQINLMDETFSVNYLPDLRRLRSSIKEIGLVQPVLLRERKGEYQIISGFRRISVMKEFGNPEIEAKVFKEEEKADLQLFSLSLHENLTTRGFNTIEKAVALDKLVYHFRIDPVIVTMNFLPLFSLEPNEKILNTYLSLAPMEDELKSYVLSEEVSRTNIRKITSLNPDDRKALLSLLPSLKLGENRLREMLTLFEEVSRKNRCTFREVIHRSEIQIILSQKELTPSQRTERMKKVLMDLRYPRMRQMEEGFERKKKELNLSSAVSLRHSPFFEGKGMSVEFQFETLEEYRSILSSLSLLAEKKEFQEMIES
jgi:ParB/RepB/Spo0J family partition protein